MIAPCFNPQMIPACGVAGEAALDEHCLNDVWLRERFTHRHTWTPEPSESPEVPDKNVRFAAVLISILLYPSGPRLLLTRRSEQLTNHPGQISFPGGRKDANDLTLVDTALREAHEEVNLDTTRVEVIGQLPEYITTSGYRVTPVAALISPPVLLKAAPDEVAEIFEVPLAYVMNGAHHQRHVVQSSEWQTQRSFYSIAYHQYFIWGATAGMLRNLFLFLRG